MRFAYGLLLAGLLTAGSAAAEPNAALPKIVLIGDSIRLGYAPIVTKHFAGKAVVVSPKANGGDSSNVLKNLESWAIKEQPDVVHFNAGIHDIKKNKKTGAFQVTPEQYEANLRKIVERLRKETKAKVFFATTTPLIDDRAAKNRTKVEYELLDASTAEYNRVARKVMKELDVPVDDLRAVIGEGESRDKLMSADGVHFTEEGKAKLGKAVGTFLEKQLATKP